MASKKSKREEKYTVLSLEDAVRRTGRWQLCYIDQIEKDCTWRYDDYPDFIPGAQEYIAYFASDVDKVWGDDWNDSLAESSQPYCDADEGIYEILEVPFAVPHYLSHPDEGYDPADPTIDARGGDVYLGDWTWDGDSYGTRLNPMFINRCRMPWMTICQYPARKPGEYVYSRNMIITSLNAGISPMIMKRKIDGVRAIHEQAVEQEKAWRDKDDIK